MNIEEQLRVEHSKKNGQHIADYIGNSSLKFDVLISSIKNKEQIIHQRASAVLGYVCEINPELITNHIDQLLICISDEQYHISVTRNFLRSLQNKTELLNETQLGKLVNYCFDAISDNNKPIAIQAFSITIITDCLTKYPELAHEFKVVLEDRLPFSLPAFKYRAKKALAFISQNHLG